MSKEVPARPDYYSWTKDAPVFPDWRKPKKDVKDQPQVKEDIWTYEGFKKLMENAEVDGVPYQQWRAKQDHDDMVNDESPKSKSKKSKEVNLPNGLKRAIRGIATGDAFHKESANSQVTEGYVGMNVSMAPPDKRPYNDGWDAYEASKTADACPYRNPAQRAEWERGYKEASRLYGDYNLRRKN